MWWMEKDLDYVLKLIEEGNNTKAITILDTHKNRVDHIIRRIDAAKRLFIGADQLLESAIKGLKTDKRIGTEISSATEDIESLKELCRKKIKEEFSALMEEISKLIKDLK